MNRRTLLKWAGSMSAPLLAEAFQNKPATEPIDIGQNAQLFFDYTLVEMTQDLTQVMHNPVRYSGNPVIRRDRPWEGVPYFVLSSGDVLYSPSEKLFRMWYEDLSFNHDKFLKDPNSDTWDYMFMHYLYAQSPDGMHWEKPSLNVVSQWGPNTNVVFGDAKYGKVHTMTILDDPRETNVARRFKALYVHSTGGRDYTIGLAWSPDAVHWTPAPQNPQFGSVGPHLSDVLILSYDPTIKRYVMLTRHPRQGGPPPPAKLPLTQSFIRPTFPWNPARESRRRIWRTESEDLIHWSELEMVLCPDDEDNWDDTYFGMVQFRRGPLLIGLLTVFHTVEDSWNIQLAFSHDGHSWKHAGARKPFLDFGADGAWDRWCISPLSQPIIVKDEMWFYYGGAINHHDYWFSHDQVDLPEARDLKYVEHGLGLAKLRLDGFISVSASRREGTLVTRPVKSAGSKLVINGVCGSGGSILAELSDLQDNVLPGYSRAECDLFSGDSVSRALTWRGKDHLSGASGIKVRFFLRNADLYSFRIADA
jgi:hypothetical protein